MDISFLNNELQTSLYTALISLMERQMQAAAAAKKSSSTESATGSAASAAQNSSSSGLYSAAPSSFAEAIEKASQRYKVDPALIQAVIQTESNFNAKAVSSCGAQGLMQLMPATARSMDVADPFDPEDNVDGGTRFLSGLLDRYDGNLKLALAAYNAGPGAVDKYGGVPPYEETQAYVQRVFKAYQQYGVG